MKIGAFSPEIPANTTGELFRKAREYGFTQMQYSYSSDASEEMPEFIPDSLNREISLESARNGIEIAAVNGTFNMVHPDTAVRQKGIACFERVASSCGIYGCKLVTLCTGTRTRERMWVAHPDNDTPEAWRDMTAVMEQLIPIADRYNVCLGIEIEATNVINTPEKAKKLIEDLRSPRLKIVMDAANLFHAGMAKRENVRSVIAGAIGLLGPWIVLAHGKDIKEGEGLAFAGAGRGIIDFHFFIAELEKAGYRGGMLLHGIKDPKDIPFCVEFMKKTGDSFSSFRAETV